METHHQLAATEGYQPQIYTLFFRYDARSHRRFDPNRDKNPCVAFVAMDDLDAVVKTHNIALDRSDDVLLGLARFENQRMVTVMTGRVDRFIRTATAELARLFFGD